MTITKVISKLRIADVAAWLGFVAASLRRFQPQVRKAKRQRADFYRDAWAEAAARISATIEPLGGDFLEIRRDEDRIRVMLNYTPIDDPVSMQLAGDKAMTLELLADAGLPVTDWLCFHVREFDRASDFLHDATYPCVVKPARGTGAGEGVTTGIHTQWQLLRAVAASGALPTKPLLIEREVPGDNYRLLIIDGELLDVVRRRPPGVVGDGRSSIHQLIEAANARRLDEGAAAAQTVLEKNREMAESLARRGLSYDSVPASGQRIDLTTVINSNSAEENESAIEETCPQVVEAAIRAAATIGARSAGVDVIATDIGRPLEETGGVILEVNTTPGFYFHYHRLGKPCRVAEHILDKLFSTSASRVFNIAATQGI